jgi:hypothetical protein
MGVRRIWSERDLPKLTTETWSDLQMRDCCQTCDPICPCSEAFDRGPGDARSAEDWDELLLPEIDVNRRKLLSGRGRGVHQSGDPGGARGAGRCGSAEAARGETEPQPSGPVQGLSRPSGFWGNGGAASGEGGYFGELFPRVGCIVKNLSLPSRGVALFYTGGVQRSNGSK